MTSIDGLNKILNPASCKLKRFIKVSNKFNDYKSLTVWPGSGMAECSDGVTKSLGEKRLLISLYLCKDFTFYGAELFVSCQ